MYNTRVKCSIKIELKIQKSNCVIDCNVLPFHSPVQKHKKGIPAHCLKMFMLSPEQNRNTKRMEH